MESFFGSSLTNLGVAFATGCASTFLVYTTRRTNVRALTNEIDKKVKAEVEKVEKDKDKAVQDKAKEVDSLRKQVQELEKQLKEAKERQKESASNKNEQKPEKKVEKDKEDRVQLNALKEDVEAGKKRERQLSAKVKELEEEKVARNAKMEQARDKVKQLEKQLEESKKSAKEDAQRQIEQEKQKAEVLKQELKEVKQLMQEQSGPSAKELKEQAEKLIKSNDATKLELENARSTIKKLQEEKKNEQQQLKKELEEQKQTVKQLTTKLQQLEAAKAKEAQAPKKETKEAVQKVVKTVEVTQAAQEVPKTVGNEEGRLRKELEEALQTIAKLKKNQELLSWNLVPTSSPQTTAPAPAASSNAGVDHVPKSKTTAPKVAKKAPVQAVNVAGARKPIQTVVGTMNWVVDTSASPSDGKSIRYNASFPPLAAFASQEFLGNKTFEFSAGEENTLMSPDRSKLTSTLAIARAVWRSIQPDNSAISSTKVDSVLDVSLLLKLNLEQGLQSLEGILSANKAGYLVGDKLSLADLGVWETLYTLSYHEPEVGKKVNSFAKVNNWYQKTSQLDACKKAATLLTGPRIARKESPKVNEVVPQQSKGGKGKQELPEKKVTQQPKEEKQAKKEPQVKQEKQEKPAKGKQEEKKEEEKAYSHSDNFVHYHLALSSSGEKEVKETKEEVKEKKESKEEVNKAVGKEDQNKDNFVTYYLALRAETSQANSQANSQAKEQKPKEEKVEAKESKKEENKQVEKQESNASNFVEYYLALKGEVSQANSQAKGQKQPKEEKVDAKESKEETKKVEKQEDNSANNFVEYYLALKGEVSQAKGQKAQKEEKKETKEKSDSSSTKGKEKYIARVVKDFGLSHEEAGKLWSEFTRHLPVPAPTKPKGKQASKDGGKVKEKLENTIWKLENVAARCEMLEQKFGLPVVEAGSVDTAQQLVIAKLDVLASRINSLEEGVGIKPQGSTERVQGRQENVLKNAVNLLNKVPAQAGAPASKPNNEVGEKDDDAWEADIQKRADEHLAAKKAAGKKQAVMKSAVVLDVKAWDDETDLNKMEELVRSIQRDGLEWKASKLVPIGYGMKKLSISCHIEDDKVSMEEIQETIQGFEDYVQSTDIQSFTKL